jgi:2-polyprenyl-3-methyl-5-hydroxy-6-metoxy-1,4-benzoquinol methylase
VADDLTTTSGGRDEDALRSEIIRLAPWHLKVELTPNLDTGVFRDAELAPEQAIDAFFIDARVPWHRLMSQLYPSGLEGKTFLDCACNCGGYSFWMRELGADGGLAFDVRERWIEQARFLQANRLGVSDGIRFEVADVYDLPRITDDQYDIAIFKGILYHLPDPIHGLRLVADRTRELLVVNTAARSDLPDGLLAIGQESTEHPMSGIHGTSWYPTGPIVISKMLASMGFTESRCTYWRKHEPGTPHGRLEVLAARDPATFQQFDESGGVEGAYGRSGG